MIVTYSIYQRSSRVGQGMRSVGSKIVASVKLGKGSPKTKKSIDFLNSKQTLHSFHPWRLLLAVLLNHETHSYKPFGRLEVIFTGCLPFHWFTLFVQLSTKCSVSSVALFLAATTTSWNTTFIQALGSSISLREKCSLPSAHLRFICEEQKCLGLNKSIVLVQMPCYKIYEGRKSTNVCNYIVLFSIFLHNDIQYI